VAILPGMFQISDEVKNALDEELAIVALETTLVTHGLPSPRGLETARAAEAAVRKAGAVPATIGILDGEVIVGLDDKQLEKLAKLGMKAMKASTRDIAALVATKRSGATTVAGTLAIASRVGIRIFATGGIGGVHRDWARIPDVSADLFALARSPVAVISAGFKSILDVAATTEMLETLGVPVVGFGTSKLPGFYVRETDQKLDHEVDDAVGMAKILRAHWKELGRNEGVLIANPPPAKAALSAKEVEPAVAEAVAAAAKEKISGKALTPFLLDLVVAKLGDKALDANASLIIHDAKVAAEIAVEYAGGKLGARRRMGY
jgi:pseudouridine-5'-phosphate glycosidase